MVVLTVLLALQLASGTASPTCESGGSAPGQALLQTHRKEPTKQKIFQHISQLPQGEGSKTDVVLASLSGTSGINPSGAAATLDEVGYGAVADRCCQAEMMQFIERTLINLDLEVCEEAGLRGIVPFHTCPHPPQSFDKLTADLLQDSTERCRWLDEIGKCQPVPEDCPTFGDVPPLADCGCNRSLAAQLDMTSATVSKNNLGGEGPRNGVVDAATDPEEIRYSSGTSSTGEPFDVVITALTPYTAGNVRKNGKDGGFGRISMKCNTSADFRFSFVVPGTNDPVVLPEVHMATFDLDGGDLNGDNLESVSSLGYYGYVTDANPSVLASLYPDGRTKFTSAGGSVDNPSDPQALTDEQRRNSVMYFYKDVSSFEINFGIAGGDKGRNLFFSFESSLDDRCGE